MLVKPSEMPAEAAEEFKQAHFANSEYVIHGGALLDTLSVPEWLNWIAKNSQPETVHADWVVASTFFGVRCSDRRIVGVIDIRHTLNDFLRNYGGHIGYSVRPDERNKGYATQMLRLALAYCKMIGLEEIMLACYKENGASSRTIVKCGGVLNRTFLDADGKSVLVYWINV